MVSHDLSCRFFGSDLNDRLTTEETSAGTLFLVVRAAVIGLTVTGTMSIGIAVSFVMLVVAAAKFTIAV